MTLVPVFLHSWGDLLPHFDEVLNGVEGQLNVISFQTNQVIWLQSEETVFMSSREKNTTLERENKGRTSQQYINELKSWQLQSNLFNSACGTKDTTRVFEEEAGTVTKVHHLYCPTCTKHVLPHLTPWTEQTQPNLPRKGWVILTKSRSSLGTVSTLAILP